MLSLHQEHEETMRLVQLLRQGEGRAAVFRKVLRPLPRQGLPRALRVRPRGTDLMEGAVFQARKIENAKKIRLFSGFESV